MNPKFRPIVASACLQDFGDMVEVEELLKKLDEEERDTLDYIYYEDMLAMAGPPPEDYELTDEEIDRLREESLEE